MPNIDGEKLSGEAIEFYDAMLRLVQEMYALLPQDWTVEYSEELSKLRVRPQAALGGRLEEIALQLNISPPPGSRRRPFHARREGVAFRSSPPPCSYELN